MFTLYVTVLTSFQETDIYIWIERQTCLPILILRRAFQNAGSVSSCCFVRWFLSVCFLIMQKGLPVSCQILQLRTNKALPSLLKNKQQQKENKQEKRSRLGGVLLVGDGGGCFQSINQLTIQYLYWGEQKLSSRDKCLRKKKESNHSLVFLYLWP